MDVDPTNSSPPDFYTVIARETPFRLTRSQIETDSPNYFTAAFLDGGFAESESRTIRIDKHPQLFVLISEHLSGYKIIPLQASVLPSYMSVEAAMENLWRDASYFGLESLCKELRPPFTIPSALGALTSKFESIIDLNRLQGEGGGLALDVETPQEYHVEGTPGKHLIRAQGVPIRLFLQDAREEDPYPHTNSILCAVIDWPNRGVRTTSGIGFINPIGSALWLDNRTAMSFRGEAVSAATLETVLQTWGSSMPHPIDIPQHAVSQRFLFATDLWDLECNVPGEFPVLDLIAEELIFRLKSREEDPQRPGDPCFRVEWEYGKLDLRGQWAHATWTGVIESLNSA